MSCSIRVSHVSKRYRRHSRHRPVTLQEAVVSGFRWLRLDDTFWALSDITFDIAGGSMAAIIGGNGAGKSTLLRLIGNVGRPELGSIRTEGRIAALIDLGTGFHPDLTGRENVYINGAISGMTRREIAARFDEILAFAGLEGVVDSPLRTWSTGMQMRLGFAVATAVRPDILLIDEVLAVGDRAFQKICVERIRQFNAEGSTILLATHDINLVEQLCDRALWLRGGRLMEFGPAAAVAGRYRAE